MYTQCVLLSVLLSQIHLKIIELPFFDFFSTLDLKVRMGNQTTEKFLELNMEAELMWVHLQFKGIPPAERVQFKHSEKIFLFNMNINAKKSETTLSFLDNTVNIPNIPFYYVQEKPGGNFDTFPLAYKLKDESYSPIHYLYKTNEIDKKGFAIDYKRANLLLGNINDKAQFKKMFTRKCTVDQKHLQWNCPLHNVVIGEDVYDNEEFAYFQSSSNRIYAPKSFFDLINENYFNSYVENNICSFGISFSSEQYVCECKILYLFPKLSFIFDNNTMVSFSSEDIFENDGNKCKFLMEESKENKWMFGLAFLKKYITYFDYGDSSITFYSDSPFEMNTINKYQRKDKVKQIYRIIFYSQLILVLFIIVVWYLNKRKILEHIETPINNSLRQ